MYVYILYAKISCVFLYAYIQLMFLYVNKHTSAEPITICRCWYINFIIGYIKLDKLRYNTIKTTSENQIWAVLV